MKPNPSTRKEYAAAPLMPPKEFDKLIRKEYADQILILENAFYISDKVSKDKKRKKLSMYIDKALLHPIAVVEKAVQNLIETSKFFPAISELLDECKAVMLNPAAPGLSLNELGERREELLTSMYQGNYDPYEWHALRTAYQEAGYICNVEHIDKRLQQIEDDGFPAFAEVAEE